MVGLLINIMDKMTDYAQLGSHVGFQDGWLRILKYDWVEVMERFRGLVNRKLIKSPFIVYLILT